MEFIHRPGVPAGDGGCFSHIVGSSNQQSILGTSPYTSSEVPFPPIGSFAHPLPSYSYELRSKAVRKTSVEGGRQSHHQRSSSESFLLEQPPWFDDLLNEPEGGVLLANKGHRRSASDSPAYLIPVACKTNNTNEEKNKLRNCITRSPWESQNLVHNEGMWQASFSQMQNSSDTQHNVVAKSSLTSLTCSNGDSSCTDGNALQTSESSSITKKHDQEEDFSSQNKQCSGQSKPSMSNGKAKPVKQCRQSAHRSGIRKLQYIVDLERSIQVLQVEGSEVSAALEFLDQQKFILDIENRALRQRLDSLSQEHMIKHLEQDMLERELARLRALHQLQLQQQQQQQPKQQRKKSRDQLNAPFAKPLYLN